MWQPCFGKANIMHKYVGCYILVLMYNSSSICYVGNIIEIKNMYTTFFLNNVFAMKWMQVSTHVLI
jgi:hypothetical protein